MAIDLGIQLIVTLFISILKILWSIKSTSQPKKGGVEINNDKKAKHNSKCKLSCNVMVTRPIIWLQHMTTHITTQMIYSYDLDTWPIKVNLIYKSQPDNQVIIGTHIRVTTTFISWLHPDLLITAACVFSKSRNLAWALSKVRWRPQGRLSSDQHSFSRSSSGSLRRVPSIITKKKLLVETTVSGQQNG